MLQTPTAALAHIQYDSFGNITKNTKPSLPLPIGFAGGLVDHDTGLVRFGYRDYDPACGRFTCPDPLGDTGGDHDLYDYCVDDPVIMIDYTGLRGTPATSTQYRIFKDALNDARGLIRTTPEDVKGLGSGIAYACLHGAGLLADLFSKPGSNLSGKFSKGISKVWPKALDIINISVGKKPEAWG